eukprot:TRINITY_DN94485_c0_g1_i1.p1 TRINITY_DN94485_c0_g1~~TRINITY_DN94485_c0_g1_i1.p1  ORF type:complete len:228 (-),score=31.65 TRINITY_DN94485_c0_g1_i1:222-863(-)
MGCGGSAAKNTTTETKEPTKNTSNNAAPAKAQPAPAVNKSVDPQSVFTAKEIQELETRFETLSKLERDDGLIDKVEFLKILKFEDSLFVDRIFKMFDADHNGKITQEEFLAGLCVLAPKGDRKAKINLSFRMWDLNNDGVIAKDELQKLMTSSMEASSLLVGEDQVSKLINATFSLADCDQNGRISIAEYEKLVDLYPSMIANMTLNFKLDSV